MAQLTTLQKKAIAYNREAKEVIWNELNKGQQKKLLKNPVIKPWLERFKIPIDD